MVIRRYINYIRLYIRHIGLYISYIGLYIRHIRPYMVCMVQSNVRLHISYRDSHGD